MGKSSRNGGIYTWNILKPADSSAPAPAYMPAPNCPVECLPLAFPAWMAIRCHKYLVKTMASAPVNLHDLRFEPRYNTIDYSIHQRYLLLAGESISLRDRNNANKKTNSASHHGSRSGMIRVHLDTMVKPFAESEAISGGDEFTHWVARQDVTHPVGW